MSTSEQLNLDDFWEAQKQKAKEARRERRRNHKTNYRLTNPIGRQVPVKNGVPFCIVPEVAPLIRELCDLCAIECPPEDDRCVRGQAGVQTLAARVALIIGKTEAGALRRLHQVIHQKQLFINASFVEACLMAMDVEHEYRDRYGEWPSSRADALERVSLEAEFAGKQLSPTRLLAKANRLYEKGVRKALKHAPEVQQ